MEPQDFCEKWLELDPNTPGYRTSCARFLEKNLQGQYSFDTINDRWGSGFINRPEKALQLLAVMDALYESKRRLSQIETEVLEAKKFIQDFLNNL